MSERYRVVSLDEIALAGTGAQWHPVRRTLGIRAFGINAWTATEDGQQVIGEHDEDRFLELAQSDDDLASIRDDPSFPRV